MGALDGRVAVITGAGRGIGREHALLFAREGARVVVNDLGGAGDGVADEILAAGGEAIANADDVADFDGARRLIEQAVQAFGRLDVLVNNAGILRDAFLHTMSEQQWDAVVHVHLKGHFSPLRHAAEHWKRRAKAGEHVRAAVINTASASGTLHANPGQANYGAAKAAIAALTMVAAAELDRYGVRANAITPVARTQMSEDVPLIGEVVRRPQDAGAFDAFHPRNVSPLVAYLASKDCPISGAMFAVQGGWISRCVGWQPGASISSECDWTIEEIQRRLEPAAVR